MVIYLLKSSACLAIFMLFYTLFLENESIHRFKRFYLLAALVLALSIPSITIYYEVPASTSANLNYNNTISSLNENSNAQTIINWPILLWTIYSMGAVLFSIKFIYNLFTIAKTIQQNPKYKSHPFINVLLEHLKTPHTFFNYIFLNKHLHDTKQIPNEVLIHEQAHANQKHSLDILFIEIACVLFWFNPLVYLLKKQIKLNHEFLADQAVLKKGASPSSYQQLLLTFSSNVQTPHMAHAINYSSIKKRFTVMKTKTTKQRMYSKGVLLLPLLAITLVSFSNHKEITKNDLSKSPNMEPSVSIATVIEDLNTSLELNMLSQDLKASPKEVEEYNTLARHYNNMPKDRMQIKKKDVERIEYLYGIMSKEQKATAEPFPSIKIPPPPPPAPKATESGKVFKGEKTPPPPPIPDDASSADKEKMQRTVDHFNNTTPPPPPPPISALEHVKAMSKKDALFYFKGKSITADEAINLISNNDNLNIETKRPHSVKPKVFISAQSIEIKD
ncbi:M56 family metallopeptidase [Geojedonia litorea]|uniref:M56 family metallopeptidase n=1 Tax=Geojedonia litorea TaxID=1268269 RepID=A0ABV9N8J5_9FLAO